MFLHYNCNSKVSKQKLNILRYTAFFLHHALVDFS